MDQSLHAAHGLCWHGGSSWWWDNGVLCEHPEWHEELIEPAPERES